MHAGDLFRVMFRHQFTMQCSLDTRGFQTEFRDQLPLLLLLLLLLLLRDMYHGKVALNARMSPEALWQQKKTRKSSLINLQFNQ
jgi:hypothetical protein